MELPYAEKARGKMLTAPKIITFLGSLLFFEGAAPRG